MDIGPDTNLPGRVGTAEEAVLGFDCFVNLLQRQPSEQTIKSANETRSELRTARTYPESDSQMASVISSAYDICGLPVILDCFGATGETGDPSSTYGE